MKANLTRELLAALRREIPSLSEWKPEIHSARRPVTVEVSAHPADANMQLRLTLGRYNNNPTMEYHHGITDVYFCGGARAVEVDLDEGTTRLGDLLRDGDTTIVTCESWRSELVESEPGSAEYTIYLRAGVTLQQVRDEVRATARQMVACLN